MYNFIEVYQVDDHAGFGVDGAADEHFDGVIMAMTKPVVAFPVCRTVGFVAKGVGVQAVAGAEHVTPAEIGFGAHASPMYSAKISDVS